MKRKARVRFQELMGSEGYIIEFLSVRDKDWVMDSWYPCFEKKGGSGTDFVHFSLLKRLAQMQLMGYDISIDC